MKQQRLLATPPLDPGQHHSGIPGPRGFDVSGVFNNMVMSPDGGACRVQVYGSGSGSTGSADSTTNQHDRSWAYRHFLAARMGP